jgi:hypothetical protein
MSPTDLLMDLELAFGHSIAQAGDCLRLSRWLQLQHRKHISPNTLKRLYGFLHPYQRPTRVTLDLLAQALGYPSYAHYQDCNLRDELGELPIEVVHEVWLTDGPAIDQGFWPIGLQQIHWRPRHAPLDAPPIVAWRLACRQPDGQQVYFRAGTFVHHPPDLLRLITLAQQEGWWPTTP